MKSSYFKILTILSVFLCASCSKDNKNNDLFCDKPITHFAHLSGSWYPGTHEDINKEIGNYFVQIRKDFRSVVDPHSVRAIIVPHAGWYYSGLCAASAYNTLMHDDAEKNKLIERVIILSPSHRIFVNGVALPEYTEYLTPLGKVGVDMDSINKLKSKKNFLFVKDVHEKEHSVEIQIPFLQSVIENFKIVPLIVGNLNNDNLAQVVQSLKDIINDKTLVVVSSDFIHHGNSYEYKPFTHDIFLQIRYLDSYAINRITDFDLYAFDRFLEQTAATICGVVPIKILMGLVNIQAFGSVVNPRLTCYYMSSQIVKAISGNLINSKKLFDIIQDKDMDSSVSYVGMIFSDQDFESLDKSDRYTDYEKKSLLRSARDKINNEFYSDERKMPDHVLFPVISPSLQRNVGAFVTLNSKKGDLRGCIGRIVSDLPLYQTVSSMAYAAAFKDDRFSGVKKEELENLVIDITILSPPVRVNSYKDIKIGRD